MALPFEDQLPFEELPFESQDKNYLDYAKGGAKGVAEGLMNLGSSLLAAPAMGLRALGEWAVTDADMPTALDRAKSSSDFLTYEPSTQEGKVTADAIHGTLDTIRSAAGRGLEMFQDITAKIPGPLGMPGRIGQAFPGAAQTLGEVGADLAPVPILGRAAPKGAPKGTQPRVPDRVEPTLGPDPMEVVRKELEVKEGLAGIPQKELLPFESPYLPKDEPLITGPDGVPFSPSRTAEMGQTVARASDQGDMFAGIAPEAYEPRPQIDPTIPYSKLETSRLAIEKQSPEGPIRTPAKRYVTDDMRLPKIEENPHALAPDRLEPGLDMPHKALEGKPLENAILDHLRQERAKTVAAKTHHPFAKRQGGVIDPELLTLGTARVFENVGKNISKLLEKFKGTFSPEAIRLALKNAHDPKSRETLVLLSPDDFHTLARSRIQGDDIDVSSPEGKKQAISMARNDFLGDEKRSSIREGLKTEEGLDDIPFLMVTKDGNVMQVIGHEGRHRMDVFAEQGMDLIPVRLIANDIRWGENYNYPRKIRGEDGHELPLPESLTYSYKEGPGFVPRSQRGSVDPEVFIEGIKKASKNVDDFTKKLVAELGEHMRPIAAALYNRESHEPAGSGEPRPTPPHAVKEQAKYTMADTRDIDEFLQAAKDMEFKDIGDIWPHVFPASNVASLASKNPAIKWIVDRALMHDRAARVNKENAKYGAQFAPKRGLFSAKWNRRLRSDDGAMTLLERMSIKDAEAAIGVWLEQFDGKKPITKEALDATNLNTQQKNWMMAASEQFKKFADEYNRVVDEANKKAGRKVLSRIKPREGYFPHLWEGDYRIKVKDTLGKTVEVWGAKTKYEADTIAKDLRARFPDYSVETGQAKSRYDINDTSAFREAMGLLDSDHELRKNLQTAYQDILKHRGFQKQTLFREGYPGFLGSKTGKEGVRDTLRAIELYLDRGYNFLANQQKKIDLAQMLEGLRKEGIDLLKKTPNAHNYMGAFVDHSTGALKNQLEAIDSIIEMAGEKAGLGRSFGRNVLGGLNGLAGAYWLTTPRFVITQLVQPLYNLPKGIQLKGQGLTQRSIASAFIQAYFESMVSPSNRTIAGMNWAKENGYIDSKILDLMGAKFDSKAKTIGTLFQTYSKYGLGKIEQEAVRTPSFIFYDILLRDTIKNDKARWEAAGMLTDKYMVDYTPTDSPLIYGHMGFAGDAARPLKQFMHAYIGQFFEYAKHAKDTKQLKPVAAFIGVQTLMAGLKGTLLVSEATAIILALNQLFDTLIPTPEEWLASSGLSDTMVFGGISQITGIDLSGSMGAPQIDQLVGFPGIDFGADLAVNVGNLALNFLKGTETEADKMNAALSVMPNWGKGIVEEAFTKPGQGTPNPNNRMIPNLGPRTSEDKVARNLGGRSLKESREMMSLRGLNTFDVQRKDHKNKAINIIVDRIAEGKEPPKHLMEKWVKLGGSPKELDEAILNQLKARATKKAIRYLGNMKGLDSAQAAERLNQFNILLEQTTDYRVIADVMKGMDNGN